MSVSLHFTVVFYNKIFRKEIGKIYLGNFPNKS